MDDTLTQFLASTELLRGLSLHDLTQIADYLEPILIQSGNALIQQGDSGDCLYILQQGELEIRLTSEDGNEVILGKIKPGKSVGEIALLTGEKRSASVFATCDASLLCFHQSDFERLREKAPDISEQFTDIIVKRLQKAELQNLLHTSEQFNCMDKDTLNDLERELELIQYSSGHYLMYEGDDSDCIYIVVSGRLQIISQQGTKDERLLIELGRGQSVGEMAIITGEKRSASVRASRESLMAKLSREGFFRLLQSHPEAITRQFTGRIINHLWLQTQGKSRIKANVANIAIIPTNEVGSLTEFCTKLCEALSTYGSTLHLNSQLLDDYLNPKGVAQISLDDPISINISRWLNKQESNYRYILYETDSRSSEWTERCLRQADRILLVGQAHLAAKSGEIESKLLQSPRYKSLPTSLALLHATDSSAYQRTDEWLAVRNVKQHYHVFYNQYESMQRLARLLTGNGIGLVFGGGGARGFAHIGGVKALRELGIPIDRIGGTSMGSVIAGMVALEWNYDTMLKESGLFNYKMDYTLPIVAITSGGNITKGLKRGFGEQKIEDSAINFFCVSTNLGRSASEIHTQGSMWKSMRASIAIPGIFPPVVEEGRLLVDGGMVNNLPVDIMHDYEDIGTTIAFDISGPVSVNTTVHMDGYFSGWQVLAHWLNPAKKAKDLPQITSTVMQAALIRSDETMLYTKDLADYHFRFPIMEYGILEFDKYQDIAETGYNYLKKKTSSLKKEDPLFDLLHKFRQK